MKFETTSPILLKRIDELTRPFHPYLQEEDEIYFLKEYTVKAGSSHSLTNKLIYNYKKSSERKEQPDWKYKQQAIIEVASLFQASIFNTVDFCNRVQQATLIPIPPSKEKNSPEYDDRNYRMLKLFAPAGDVRELLLQKQSREPLHASTRQQRSHVDLLNNYHLNEEVHHPRPKEIWLFDDVLTKGTHFRAAKEFLKQKIPNVSIIGFFIARSIVREIN